MLSEISILGFHIPMYGLLIITGAVVANIIAYFFIKKFKLDINNFIVLEAYAILGGFLGAKGLYLWVNRNVIQWDKMLQDQYFQAIMNGGFVFYGGLILGTAFVLLAGKLHKIDCIGYAKKVIFMIPIIHGFGRMGCFCAGCCYGVPYSGLGAVKFPKGSLAPSDVTLFPVQLVESIALWIIAGVIIVLILKYHNDYVIEIYFITYAILRFVLEEFRYDSERGYFLFLSTSQWISVAILCVAIAILIIRKSRKGSLKED